MKVFACFTFFQLWLCIASTSTNLINSEIVEEGLMIGFKYVGRYGETITLNGNWLIAYSVPGFIEYTYGNGLTQHKCGSASSNSNGACYVNSLSISWEKCAEEGQSCNISANSIVRFGEGNSYRMFHYQGSLQCNINSLGDPSPGRTKHCAILRFVWSNCGNEGSRCNFQGKKLVKLGYSGVWAGKYAYAEAVDGIDCSKQAFNQDPYPGQYKHCEYLSTPVVWKSCADTCSFFGATVIKRLWSEEVFQGNGKYTFSGKASYEEAVFQYNCTRDQACFYATFE